jgi:hypothetical protein
MPSNSLSELSNGRVVLSLAGAAIAIALATFAAWDALPRMVRTWSADEYSYAYFVPFLVLFFIWQKKHELAQVQFGGSCFFCQTPSVLRDIDSSIRHSLRCVYWMQWKVYRRRKVELLRLCAHPVLAHTTACSVKGPWRIGNTPGVRIALDNGYFDALRLPRLEPRLSI